MEIATAPRRGRRILARALALVLPLAGVAVVSTVVASPASASTCATDGHAYLIGGGGIFYSGFEGDQRFGVPTATVTAGSYIQLGGNGIRPNTSVTFLLNGGVWHINAATHSN